jgi:hypothetical protein
MGIRVVRGRHLDRGDVDRKAPVVVANQAFVDRYFPNQDPIGEQLASNRAPDQPGEPPDLKWLEIVGVVSNTPSFALAEADPEPQLYMPMSIAGGPDIPMSALIGPNVAMMSYVVRSAGQPRGLLPSVRHVVDVVDKGVAIANVRTLQDVLDEA